MFGKNDNDEYTEDYIRPSEEYYDSGSDPYNGYDEEHRTYNEYNSIESEFSNVLMLDEQLLWVGKTQKRAGMKAKGTNAAVMIFPVFWLMFACFWTAMASIGGGLFGLFGVPFILIGIFMLKQFLFIGEQKYAITNQRVLKYAGKKLSSEMLCNITDITVFDAGNNLGYVKYSVIANVYQNSRYGVQNGVSGAQNGFLGIEDPHGVYRILSDAVYSASAQK